MRRTLPSSRRSVLGTLKVAELGEPWLVSYAACEPIADLYADFFSIEYSLAYSANGIGTGSERLYFSPSLRPPVVDQVAGIWADTVERFRATLVQEG